MGIPIFIQQSYVLTLYAQLVCLTLLNQGTVDLCFFFSNPALVPWLILLYFTTIILIQSIKRFILRFVSALNSNEVADRIVMAMRCNEQFVILPGYFQGLLAAKWCV